jgi:hypothetical protein
MVRFPYEIRYAIAIDQPENNQAPRWLGTGSILGTGKGHLGDHPAFALRDGWIILTSTDLEITSKTQRFVLPVGHTLGRILQAWDELKVWRNANGCWTYWLVREGDLVIGVGYLNGPIGRDVEIVWHSANIESPRSTSSSELPIRVNLLKANSKVSVRMADNSFDLSEKEEINDGPYYLKCLDLGDHPGSLGGWPPRIAILKTNNVGARESLASYLAFQDQLSEAFMVISHRLFDEAPDGERKPYAPGEYMAERAKKFEEREEAIREMYRVFSMPYPTA